MLSQEDEVDASLEFLRSVGARTDCWIICYLYCAYNEDTLSLFKDRNCSAGPTTKVGFANLLDSSALQLARFDTNDFPQ